MEEDLDGTESLVIFRNSQGIEGRGTLIHLTRNMAVFEVYNPYSIVQLSEVVDDLRILRGGRTVYSGRAVVANLVTTGLMSIVSVTLVDPWSDLAGLAPGDGLQEEVEQFIAGWEKRNKLRPDYQVAVADLSTFLSELNPWLQQAEAAVGLDEEDDDPELEEEFLNEVLHPLEPKVKELFYRFEEEADNVPEDEETTHKSFAKRELHPYLMCSPFVHRTYHKPLGYAGDYEMVNMILRNQPEGKNMYAKLVHSVTLSMDAAQAHRNRIDMLAKWLQEEAQQKESAPEPLRVLNVGCGPAAEITEFMKAEPLSDQSRIDLIDFSEETLEYTRERMQEAMRASGRRPEINYIHKSVHELLKETVRMKREAPESDYDFVYCAGLFDYLTDKVASRLLKLFSAWTDPGGLIVATNVHPRNPGRHYMEHLLEWNLIYRDEQEMKGLAPDRHKLEIVPEDTGVNIFLRIRTREQ